MFRFVLIAGALICAFSVSPLAAGDSPQEQRHALMEETKDAAKPIGGMLKGEVPFDAATAQASLATWARVAEEFGGLFPEGTETGFDTRARAEIWTDRAGFDAEMQTFVDVTRAANDAGVETLDDLKAAAGPIFKNCKSCHEGYRAEKD